MKYRSEKVTIRQPFLSGIDTSSKYSPCRFRLPLSFEERLSSRVRGMVHALVSIGFLPESSGISRSGYPSGEWDIILRYLYRSGVINAPAVRIEDMFNDEVKFFSLRLYCALDAITVKTDGHVRQRYMSFARGISRDLGEAYSKVIGEQLERYSLMLYRDKELCRASVKDMEKKRRYFLHPSLLAGFSPEQKRKYSNREWDDTSLFQWVSGHSLTKNQSAFLPAQLVFWNYKLLGNEPLLQQQISNGAAGMFSLKEAILAGLYELIQRDGFLLFWLNRIAPPRIDPDSIDNEAIAKLVADARRYHLDVDILDITSDLGVPAFTVVIRDKSGIGPSVSIGGGSAIKAESAILRAFLEALSVRHWLRERLEGGATFTELPEKYKPFSSHSFGQEERLLLWANPAMASFFDFFLKAPLVLLQDRHRQVHTVSVSDEIAFLKGLFAERGPAYEIFFYEAKNEALKTLGYHSVRVLVPALVPLYLDETLAPLGSKRIKHALEKMKHSRFQEVNTLPHPFP